MSTLYVDTNPDLPEGFGEFFEERHPLFTDEEIEAMERRREQERIEFEQKMRVHNELLYKAEMAMSKLKKITL